MFISPTTGPCTQIKWPLWWVHVLAIVASAISTHIHATTSVPPCCVSIILNFVYIGLIFTFTEWKFAVFNLKEKIRQWHSTWKGLDCSWHCSAIHCFLKEHVKQQVNWEQVWLQEGNSRGWGWGEIPCTFAVYWHTHPFAKFIIRCVFFINFDRAMSMT